MSIMRSIAVGAFAVAIVVLDVQGAFGQSSVPDPDAWVTDKAVYAIARSADTTYIGGWFTYVGPYTGNGVPIDAASGAPVPVYPKVNGIVNATVSDGSGGWYIGGTFTQVGEVARKNIAHILSDGSVDAAWNPNANRDVYALAVSGTTVYAGGWFSSIGGQPRNNIAALDATTGAATAWNPNASGEVEALAVSGTTVYAGGSFTSIGGQPRNRIAALDTSTGASTAWDPNANGGVDALAVSGTTLYVSGTFSQIGAAARNYIAALDASGTATAWNPNPSGGIFPSLTPSICALAVSGTTVYTGGVFTSIGGQPRSCIAALDASGAATAWNPNPSGGFYGPCVHALVISGTTVYVGGLFTSIGGQTRNAIAALDELGAATDWNPGAYGGSKFGSRVYALAVSGTTVYAGGIFSIIGGPIGGQTRNYVAALDESGAATAWNPNADSWVSALAVSDTAVYVGGEFSIMGGNPRPYYAQFPILPLEITQQPTGGSRYVGDSYTFVAGASGGVLPLSYQWRRDGSNVDGATSTDLALGPLALGDAGGYDCIVTDSGLESVTSDVAVLNVTDHLAITTQPEGATLMLGDPYTLFVETEGGYLPLTYQWIKDGTDIPLATKSSYEIASFAGTDAGAYTVVVHDNFTDEKTSDPAELRLRSEVPVAGLTGLAAAVLAASLLGALRLRRRTK